jgi:hypothetical protein
MMAISCGLHPWTKQTRGEDVTTARGSDQKMDPYLIPQNKTSILVSLTFNHLSLETNHPNWAIGGPVNPTGARTFQVVPELA